MFTGIIEDLRPVMAIRRGAASSVLALDLGHLVDDAAIGDSIAVNGMCLTVTSLQGAVAEFDVSTETLSRTSFATLQPGHRVNVERSLRVGDRLGGHFVLGHVDGVAEVKAARREPGQWTFTFGVAADIAAMLIDKGSVAVDGISLTVIDLTPDSFSVAVIPHTFEHTTLSFKRERDVANIETDMLGKWVKKLLMGQGPAPASTGEVLLAKLQEGGFA